MDGRNRVTGAHTAIGLHLRSKYNKRQISSMISYSNRWINCIWRAMILFDFDFICTAVCTPVALFLHGFILTSAHRSIAKSSWLQWCVIPQFWGRHHWYARTNLWWKIRFTCTVHIFLILLSEEIARRD